MSQPRKIPFVLVRSKNFIFLILRNRMAIGGLIILLVFTFLAVSAPFLTPYGPQSTVVSGPFDPPAWAHYFTGQTDYSLNEAFANPTVQALSPGIQVTVQSQTKNSITFSVNAPASGGTILVSETVHHQYNGAAKSFQGNIAVTPASLNSGNATATVYLQKSTGGCGSLAGPCVLWTDVVSDLGREYSPPAGFVSSDSALLTQIGLGSTVYDAAQAIFIEKTDYVFGLRLNLSPGLAQAVFKVENFGMILYGNVWGLLGTDNVGHDIFSQFVYGTQISLFVGLVAAFVGIGLGLFIGLLAGYIGTFVDEVLMRFTDMMLVLPSLPLLIVLVAVLGPSIFNIILVIGFLGWMGFARIVRSQVLSLRERPFIEAARASGGGTGYILASHIFPNIVSLTYVNLALSVPSAIVSEAALSFLGLGPQTVLSWGRMLELGRDASGTNLLWWWMVPPGIGIAILSLSFIFIGYALDEIFNPKLRKRR